MPVTFKTLKKHNVLIIKQPYIYTERTKTVKGAGKMKAKRQVRYVEHLDSIFLDEQVKIDPKANQTPVYIKKGNITIPDENPQLIQFFDLHVDNIANGGHKFKKLDIEKEELFEIEKFEALDEARSNIMKADEDSLRAAAVFFVNPTMLRQSISRIKLKLRQTAEITSQSKEDPLNFVNKLNSFFADKNNTEKLTVTIALKEGIVDINGKKVSWGDSKETIFISGQTKDAIKEFAIWLKNDEKGRQALSVLAGKIKNIE